MTKNMAILIHSDPQRNGGLSTRQRNVFRRSGDTHLSPTVTHGVAVVT